MAAQGNEKLARLSEYVRTKGALYFIDNPSQAVVDCFKGTLYDTEGTINFCLLNSLLGNIPILDY